MGIYIWYIHKVINVWYFTSQGGVVLVSHDERLIRMICKELWVAKDRTVKALDGGFDEYRKIVENELAENGVWWRLETSEVLRSV